MADVAGLTIEQWSSLSHTDRRQLEVLLEAFTKFQERNAKYQDLWIDDDLDDLAANALHKAKRLKMAAQNIAQLDPLDFVDDAIDLMNYAAFFVRSARDGVGD